MKRLSEFQDEEALELLADILDPVVEIAQDADVQKVFEKGSKLPISEGVKLIIKGHASAVMQILAALDGVPFEEYHCNILSLPRKVMEIVNDKELVTFFHEQGQMASENTFGSAMESTEGEEQ